MSLTSKVTAAVTGSMSKAHSTSRDSAYALSLSSSLTLTSGTGNSQADQAWDTTSTLALSTSESWDLSGALVDALGTTTVFAKIKAIMVTAATGNTNDVVIGNGTNPFVGFFGAGSHTVAVKPGGVFVMAAPNAGWTVTAGTGDILKIANGGAGSSVTYSITILGTSV